MVQHQKNKFSLVDGESLMKKHTILGFLLTLLTDTSGYSYITEIVTSKIGPKTVILFGDIHDLSEEDHQQAALNAFFEKYIYKKPTRTGLYLETKQQSHSILYFIV
jgi:hypothetical protein